jgi:hypothetical protein
MATQIFPVLADPKDFITNAYERLSNYTSMFCYYSWIPDYSEDVINNLSLRILNGKHIYKNGYESKNPNRKGKTSTVLNYYRKIIRKRVCTAREEIRKEGFTNSPYGASNQPRKDLYRKEFENFGFHEIAMEYEPWDDMKELQEIEQDMVDVALIPREGVDGSGDIPVESHYQDIPFETDDLEESVLISSLRKALMKSPIPVKTKSRLLHVFNMTLAGFTGREIAKDLGFSDVYISYLKNALAVFFEQTYKKNLAPAAASMNQIRACVGFWK